MIVVLPGFLGPWCEECSVLQGLAQRGRIRRLAVPPVAAPEALWIGLPPAHADLADGPLMVAALGQEPPERSIQFHLSLLGLEDGVIVAPEPTPKEAAAVMDLLPKLNTKVLTGLAGEGVDHALVLEALWDFGTTTRDGALGQRIETVRPEGEGESALRRYVDDSVNMLSDLEFNRRRIDEGIAPVNLLWPWGQGMPRRLPNLAIRRGEVATIESGSFRLQGLARLVGYRHAPRFREGLEIDWEGLATGGNGFVISESFSSRDEEETAWLAKELDQRFLGRLPDGELLLLAPNQEGGLLIEISEKVSTDGVPFRSEVAEDRNVEAVDLAEAVDQFLI